MWNHTDRDSTTSSPLVSHLSWSSFVVFVDRIMSKAILQTAAKQSFAFTLVHFRQQNKCVWGWRERKRVGERLWNCRNKWILAVDSFVTLHLIFVASTKQRKNQYLFRHCLSLNSRIPIPPVGHRNKTEKCSIDTTPTLPKQFKSVGLSILCIDR